MKKKNKIILAVIVTISVSGLLLSQPIVQKNKYINSIISSLNNNDFIQASGQFAGGNFVTIAVETRTTNKLPNITGTCSVGGNMNFTIKKGVTNQVSETINKYCDASPYSLNPTIVLPDGKYRVDVTIDQIAN